MVMKCRFGVFRTEKELAAFHKKYPDALRWTMKECHSFLITGLAPTRTTTSATSDSDSDWGTVYEEDAITQTDDSEGSAENLTAGLLSLKQGCSKVNYLR